MTIELTPSQTQLLLKRNLKAKESDPENILVGKIIKESQGNSLLQSRPVNAYYSITGNENLIEDSMGFFHIKPFSDIPKGTVQRLLKFKEIYVTEWWYGKKVEFSHDILREVMEKNPVLFEDVEWGALQTNMNDQNIAVSRFRMKGGASHESRQILVSFLLASEMKSLVGPDSKRVKKILQEALNG